MNILGIFLLKQTRTGGDRRYLELVEALAERGNTVTVIMNSLLDYTPRCFKKIELTIPYIYRGFPPASFLFKKNLKKSIDTIITRINDINDGKIDCLHIHGDTHLKAALFLKKRLGIPLFYASRNDDIDKILVLRKHKALSVKKYLFSLIYNPINRFREQQIGRFADLITFQCNTERKMFLNRTGVNKSKTLIIPGNIGLPRCTDMWKNQNTSSSLKNILYVGLLSKDKGLYDLLKALKTLLQRGKKSFTCTILGRLENTEPLLKVIKDYNLEDHIQLVGYQDPFPYLKNNDLMVYPALYDAFPDAILEALHVGCPVIASRTGGLPDILYHDELLFDVGDIEAIARKVERCMADNEYYQSVRLLCEERVHHFIFNWAEQFEKAIAGLSVKIN